MGEYRKGDIIICVKVKCHDTGDSPYVVGDIGEITIVHGVDHDVYEVDFDFINNDERNNDIAHSDHRGSLWNLYGSELRHYEPKED